MTEFSEVASAVRFCYLVCKHSGGLRRERNAEIGEDNSRPAAKLSRAAMSFRVFHAAIAAEELLAIAYVWWCAITGRRDRLLCVAVATLIGEGVLVTANRGECPLRGLQERLGDPVPLFELVLSPGAAKRAVTTMGAITAAGLVLLVVRSPRDTRQEAKNYQISRVWLAGSTSLMFILAALAVMGWWVPFGWWRVLAMGGATLSLLLMVGFFGATKLVPMALNDVVMWFAITDRMSAPATG